MTAGITTRIALRSNFFKKYERPIPSTNWREAFTDEEKNKIVEKINENVLKQNGKSLSNGSLMRISPLAIAFRNMNDSELRDLAKLDASITHCHPVALDAAATYVIAFAALLKGANKEEAYNKAFESAETDMVREFMKDAKTHAIPVKLYQEDFSQPFVTCGGDDKFMGYLGIALQSAFHELLHAESFATGLENVISRGGDADTNSCIVGALLGARFGESSIPTEWIETVRRASPCLFCESNGRESIDMSFLSIKDMDTLVPELAKIS